MFVCNEKNIKIKSIILEIITRTWKKREELKLELFLIFIFHLNESYINL
jgi:hypothetical protein